MIGELDNKVQGFPVEQVRLDLVRLDLHDIRCSQSSLCPPKNSVTDRPTDQHKDGPTDGHNIGRAEGRTHPLIELRTRN